MASDTASTRTGLGRVIDQSGYRNAEYGARAPTAASSETRKRMTAMGRSHKRRPEKTNRKRSATKKRRGGGGDIGPKKASR
jgi:hypothetical protein